jgi:hypothetical protein
MRFTVTCQNGMVSIDSDDFSFSLIANMYTTGHGSGLQVADEENRQYLQRMCNKISDAVLEATGDTPWTVGG